MFKAKETPDITQVAIACQGGGSHAAFTAGVLKAILGHQTDEYRIMGLSGTSGGAICALLAWYGMLKGGTVKEGWGWQTAIQLLDALWHDNTPVSLWEELWNWWCIGGSSLPLEVALSPYQPPLSWTEELLKFWPRQAFVNLEALLREHVNFDAIQKIGAFQKIEADVKHWRLMQDVQELEPFGSGWTAEAPTLDLATIQAQVATANAEIQKLKEFERCKALIAEATAEILCSQNSVDVERVLKDLAKQIPILLIGAVDVLGGTFKAFNSKKGEISVEAVLASAAIPWIFRAAKIAGQGAYWDGLFSQNPPITNFVTDADEADEKPDELWVVQINPQKLREEPTSADNIRDRRNELAGNLSLNQELAAIKAVNKRLSEGSLVSTRLKRIDVYWILMDPRQLEPRWRLDLPSKLNRNWLFIQELIEHGVEQAQRFWPIRRLIAEVWNRFTDTGWDPQGLAVVDQICAADTCIINLPPHLEIGGPAGSTHGIKVPLPQQVIGCKAIKELIRVCHEPKYFPDLRIAIEGKSDVELGKSAERSKRRGQVKLRWSARGTYGNRQVTLEGTGSFTVECGKITAGQIERIAVEKIREVEVMQDSSPQSLSSDTRR
jgi:predicted acylesterase/phospholipase RssA